MTPDLLTVILAGALLVMAVITPMMSPLFRRLHSTGSPSPAAPLPKVTVLLVSNGDHVALDEHLPVYLTQDYAPGYEVVVVTEKADVETENVLKRYSHDEKLYHTFVPESSRYMSKSKLAITLGVKAAKNEWVILTDPRCKPSGNHWIEAMAKLMTDESNMVLGYVNLAEEAKPYYRFERLHTALYLLRTAQSHRAYRTNCMHVSFRKSEFMRRNGFLEYLKYSIGEYDFLVNKFSEPGSTVVATDPDTWLQEDPLSQKSWQNKQVYFHEVGKHLDGGLGVRLTRIIDQWALHLNNLLIVGCIVFAACTSRWILLGAALLALVLTFILRTLNGKKAFREFDVKVPAWKTFFYETGMARHAFLTRMRYEYADKDDFISHKV